MKRPKVLIGTSVLVVSLVMSCRESIDSTSDLRYQDLIVGSWIYPAPDGSSSITLLFSDSDVRVINTRQDAPVDTIYNYFIDSGLLHFTTNSEPPVVVFTYVIDQLDFSILILSFSSGGELVRQTYSRTSP